MYLHSCWIMLAGPEDVAVEGLSDERADGLCPGPLGADRQQWEHNPQIREVVLCVDPAT
jgi:hypothetical protein